MQMAQPYLTLQLFPELLQLGKKLVLCRGDIHVGSNFLNKKEAEHLVTMLDKYYLNPELFVKTAKVFNQIGRAHVWTPVT